MNFSLLYTSSWDSSLLDGMLRELRAAQGDLPDVSMVEEDFNVREETININDTEIEETIDIDSEHTIELSDSDNEIDCEVVNQIIESTINITDEDTVENVSNMEYSNESDEDENTNSNNISSSQYFPECPVHNHHTDNDSVCPDDPPCSCMSEIFVVFSNSCNIHISFVCDSVKYRHRLIRSFFSETVHSTLVHVK